MHMNLKQLAAARAVEWVQSGMVLGLGTGSTTRYAIELIGERLRDGRLRDITGVPTSRGTVEIARQAAVPLTTLQEHPVLDLTIDGADEVRYSAPLRRVEPDLVLIKGQGGALLHEKIVARASRQEIIIVDETKLVQVLGTKAPLAVEVIPFGWGTYSDALVRLGCEPVLRLRASEEGETPYITDEGNYIVDCRFPRIEDPVTLERELNLIPGVVDNGLFIGLVTLVVVASPSGIRELRPSPSARRGHRND
jgi:ribose 5-phosphate isomerase A